VTILLGASQDLTAFTPLPSSLSYLAAIELAFLCSRRTRVDGVSILRGAWHVLKRKLRVNERVRRACPISSTMSSAGTPLLPQAVGYGVGISNHSVLVALSSIGRRNSHWDWPLLQRTHDSLDVGSSAVHGDSPGRSGRVHQREPFRQAGSHSECSR
jgi:hypothetical protein